VIARTLLAPLSQSVMPLMRQPWPACVLTGREADADVALLFTLAAYISCSSDCRSNYLISSTRLTRYHAADARSASDHLAIIVAVFANYNRHHNFAYVHLEVLATYPETFCTLLVTAPHKLSCIYESVIFASFNSFN